jgi:transaldolase/glucose-6-phosphate isomerase
MLTRAALACGQSIWLDGIDRKWIENGFLKNLVEVHGIRGLTSNPSIFEKAMTHGESYEAQIRLVLSQETIGVKALYEQLAIRDIQLAADILRVVYDSSGGTDGFVSLEVSPALAHDTERTLNEAQRLWKSVDRPNLMIKVPATLEGVPAIRSLIAGGISVNVTLLFSRERYLEAAEAYMSGLEERVRSERPIQRVVSVASFFVSRIDVAADRQLALFNNTELQGKIAIANAKIAYNDFQTLTASTRWQELVKKGAQAQRILWASTSTKDPAYRDTLYVEELMGAQTVNTLPLKTFEAFEEHGQVRNALTENVKQARAQLDTLEQIGISLNSITDELLVQAIKKFSDPFDELMTHLEKKRLSFYRSHSQVKIKALNDISIRILPQWMSSFSKQLTDWQERAASPRLWQKDASLWTGSDESKWLDWLAVMDWQIERLEDLQAFSKDVKAARFTDAVLLGMGGSSLVAEVLSTTFNEAPGFPDFHILDSTDPDQIGALTQKINLEKTLFIVSSKSGTTLEPNIFFDYFEKKLLQAAPTIDLGRHFIAITDPGSSLEKVALEKHFWKIFHGIPGIGGRYSALSDFGLIPAAVLGVDLERFLNHAKTMQLACEPEVPANNHPGVMLGAALGGFALLGRNKVTLVVSPEICVLGAWLEQLLAESTGKQGRGLIPIVDEELGEVSSYGDDRVFVHLDYPDGDTRDVSARLDKLERDGQPVIRITVPEKYSIAQEFFRWEMATAVAGSILKINPFNQPDVESSKVEARRLTDEYEKNGSLPQEHPFFYDGEIQLFASERDQKALKKSLLGERPTLAGYLAGHITRIKNGDYFAVLAYLSADPATDRVLQSFRNEVRRSKKVATCVGYGPKFLHSTGQAYKGGPNQGVFIQITTAHHLDLPVPGHRFDFGLVEAAQARGDLQVLESRERRVLRIHFLKKSLTALEKTLTLVPKKRAA